MELVSSDEEEEMEDGQAVEREEESIAEEPAKAVKRTSPGRGHGGARKDSQTKYGP